VQPGILAHLYVGPGACALDVGAAVRLSFPIRLKHGTEIGGAIRHSLDLAKGDGKMVDRIRSLLARCAEDEQSVRQLMATESSFDLLCQEYHRLIELLDGFDEHVKRLRQLRALLEEELLTRIEGYQPQ